MSSSASRTVDPLRQREEKDDSHHHRDGDRRHSRRRDDSRERDGGRDRKRSRKDSTQRRRRSSSRSRSPSSPSSSSASSRSPSPSRSRRKESRKSSSRVKKEKKSRRRSTSSERAAHLLARRLRRHGTASIIDPVTSDSALLHGYSNESNPFNDSNLTQSFVWKKKIEVDLERGGSVASVSAEERRRKQRELAAEIEEVKKRRAEREEERIQMDAMREQMDRERAAETVAGWEEKEEDFHRQQAKKKTRIRMQERREKAIDLLVKNVTFDQWIREEEQQRIEKSQFDRMKGLTTAPAPPPHSVMLDMQLTDPVSLLSALGLAELMELRGEVQYFVELKENVEYWKAVLLVLDDDIRRGKKEGKDRGVSAAVMRDIEDMMKGKSVAELERLETKVHNTLEEAGVDVVYWGAVLMELHLCKAIAFLRELYGDLLHRRLLQVKADRETRGRALPTSSAPTPEGSAPPLSVETEMRLVDMDHSNADHHLSPRLFALDEELDIDVISTEEEQRELHQQRQAALQKYLPTSSLLTLPPPPSQPTSSSDPSPHEYSLHNEVSLPTSIASWHSKYRPRKPRYFNRVKTGFEWNKYNQVHYDKENPPPKIVQGYKFNVFYPDLIDPTVTPRYRVEPSYGEGGVREEDYCVLRFMGGAPYEDVAFKIVRKEWEFAPRRGFKCVFDKGVLSLWFGFRRYFYRR